MFKNLLIPVDVNQSDIALQALSAAKPYVNGAKICIMNVRYIVPQMMGEYLPDDFDDRADEEARGFLKKLARESGLDESQVNYHVALGTVYHEILLQADKIKSDLIIIGSHHPTMATYLIGSNAQRVVRHAKCSVLVVRV
ncbi:MAG: universal stress protein [Pseudomonadota bacterium]